MPLRVEGALDGAVEGADFLRDGQRPPALLGQADAVFAGDRAAPGEDLREELVQRGLAAAFGARLGEVHHEVGVDVAVAGVAETGDGEAVLALEPGGEVEQVLEPAARDDDVLVELGQAGVAQGVGELAADLPDGFALGRAEAALDEEGLLRREDGAGAGGFRRARSVAGRRVRR